MKIIFPCSTFYPAQIGGPNNTLLWHTTFLKENDLNPLIITSDFGIIKSRDVVREKWAKQSFGDIIYHHEYSRKIPLKVFLTTLNNIKGSDVVHFNGMYNKVTLSLIFVVTLLGKPIVISPRGELFGAALRRKSLGKTMLIGLYSLIKNNILFHATSEREVDTVTKYFGNVRVVLQPNFIKANYGTNKNLSNRDFLFLGRINPIKNIHLLIEAASNSSTFLESDSIIRIAGEARLNYEIQYKKELIDLINELNMQNKVKFVGHVENDQKEAVLENSYFIVLPSKSENFGNVVLEALIKGTPVIASKGTPWQNLIEYNAGYWIDNDIDSIKSTLELALKLDHEGYLRMSENAKKLVEKEYDSQSDKNKWIEIYSSLVNKRV